MQDTVKALKQRPAALEAFAEYTERYQGIARRQEDIAADTTLVKVCCVLRCTFDRCGCWLVSSGAQQPAAPYRAELSAMQWAPLSVAVLLKLVPQ